MGLSVVVVELRIVWMDADARKHVLVFLSNSNSLPKIVGMRIASPHIQHGRNAGFPRTLDNLVPIVVKRLAVNMAMRIDEGHFKRAPILTSSKNVAIAGVSSSVSEAAQIIPWDSRPRIFRGLRFATTTTLRPISFSGSYHSARPARI